MVGIYMNRNHLELALQGEIEKRNFSNAKKLIDMINYDQDADLASFDDQNKSFLSHALENGFIQIVPCLLEKQINNNLILFKKNNLGLDCLYYAIERGYIEIVKTLLDASSQIKKGNLGFKLWLQSYPEANTPLHIAIKYKNIAITKNLLEKISLEPDAINWLNRADQQLNTPLHFAICSESIGNEMLIAELLMHGADLTLPNQNNQTPLDRILMLPFKNQIDLFHLLSDKNHVAGSKEIFLKLYREKVIESSFSKVLINQYYRLSSIHSLQAAIGAKLEFNKTMPIRNFYTAVESNLENDSINYVDRYISNNILNSIPIYKNKVEKEEGKLNRKNNLFITESSEEDSESEIHSTYLHQLHEDLITLNNFIAQIDTYILDLNNKPSIIFSHKQMLYTAIFIIFLAYIGIEAWLGVMNKRHPSFHDMTDERLAKFDNSTDDEIDEYDTLSIIYSISALTFGISVPISLLMLFFSLTKLSCSGGIANKIYSNEWEEIKNAGELILKKLQLLEKIELDHNQSYDEYGISSQTLRDFENTVGKFGAHNMLITDLITELSNLSAHSKNIKTGLINNHKGFSLVDCHSLTLFGKRKEIEHDDSSSSNSLVISVEETSGDDSDDEYLFDLSSDEERRKILYQNI